MPAGERGGDRRRIDRTVAPRDRLAGRERYLSVVRQSPLVRLGNHDRRPKGFIRPPEGVANGAADNTTENPVSHKASPKIPGYASIPPRQDSIKRTTGKPKRAGIDAYPGAFPLAYFFNGALIVSSDPAVTVISFSQFLYPSFPTRMRCFPGTSFNCAGAFPTDAPSTQMSAPSGCEVTLTTPDAPSADATASPSDFFPPSSFFAVTVSMPTGTNWRSSSETATGAPVAPRKAVNTAL